jgi:biotin carboxyl carrier protein
MNQYKYTINGTQYEVAIGDIEDCNVTVTVNGEEYKVEMEKPAEPEKKKPVLGKPATAESAEKSENADSAKPVNKNNAVKAPLPGVITDILVSVGDEVKVGDTVVVLEAMPAFVNAAGSDGRERPLPYRPLVRNGVVRMSRERDGVRERREGPHRFATVAAGAEPGVARALRMLVLAVEERLSLVERRGVRLHEFLYRRLQT